VTHFASLGHEPAKTMSLCARQAARTPAQVFSGLSAAAGRSGADFDVHGNGQALSVFEAEVAGICGKESGVFMPTGTMASPVYIRQHSNAGFKNDAHKRIRNWLFE
jgi:threonine aldolase